MITYYEAMGIPAEQLEVMDLDAMALEQVTGVMACCWCVVGVGYLLFLRRFFREERGTTGDGPATGLGAGRPW